MLYTHALRVMLYIPLRSDKTCSRSTIHQERRRNFISHYVQIKPEQQREYIKNCIDFISHYVQIKLSVILDGTRLRDIFISHYVQIKPLR